MKSQPERIDRIAASNVATERANLAETRLAAWNALSRALIRLMLAYEGHELHPTIKSWYRGVMAECTGRRSKLREIARKERESAQYQMEMFNNGD